VGVVAPEVLHEDVGGIRFGREAVVADVDSGVCYAEAVDVQGVEAVGIFRESLTNTCQM
jgi:hypothetical protein